MEEWQIEKYKELQRLYEESRMIKYGSPDQYQYRQNALLQYLAEFFLIPYWQYQNDMEEKNDPNYLVKSKMNCS